MKTILNSLVFALSFSTLAQADVLTLDCKTEPKKTSLVLKYDNYSKQTNRAELISLIIGGQNMSSKIDRFSTSGGRPNFTLIDFPQVGQSTRFNIYATGTYTVMKNGSFSGQDYDINCDIQASAKEKEDNSF